MTEAARATGPIAVSRSKRPTSAPANDSLLSSPRIGSSWNKQSASACAQRNLLAAASGRQRSESPSLRTYHATSLHGVAAQNRHELTALQRELTHLRTSIIRSRACSPGPGAAASSNPVAWQRTGQTSAAQPSRCYAARGSVPTNEPAQFQTAACQSTMWQSDRPSRQQSQACSLHSVLLLPLSQCILPEAALLCHLPGQHAHFACSLNGVLNGVNPP